MSKQFLNPKEFAKETGLTYQNVLHLCKTNELGHKTTVNGRRFLIPVSELLKFQGGNNDYISIQKYEEVVRENERLKILINQFKELLKQIN
jgi:hypothetical protein